MCSGGLFAAPEKPKYDPHPRPHWGCEISLAVVSLEGRHERSQHLTRGQTLVYTGWMNFSLLISVYLMTLGTIWLTFLSPKFSIQTVNANSFEIL